MVVLETIVWLELLVISKGKKLCGSWIVGLVFAWLIYILSFELICNGPN